MTTSISDCHICQRIQLIKQGKNANLVKELSTGYAVIGDYQTFKGYSLFLSKYHASELHELPKNIRQQFLEEMSLVAEAVYNCFQPYKLNYELLGNSDQHLHWHLFPRYLDDPAAKGPVWRLDKAKMYAPENRPSESELKDLVKRLGIEIEKLL